MLVALSPERMPEFVDIARHQQRWLRPPASAPNRPMWTANKAGPVRCFYNGHRPTRPRQRPTAVPTAYPMTNPHEITQLRVRRRDRLGGILHEYDRAA